MSGESREAFERDRFGTAGPVGRCKHCGDDKSNHHYVRGGYVCDRNLTWFELESAERGAPLTSDGDWFEGKL